MIRCAVITGLKTFRDGFAAMEIAAGRKYDGRKVGNVGTQHFFGAHVLEVRSMALPVTNEVSGGVELVVSSLDFVFADIQGILDAL